MKKGMPVFTVFETLTLYESALLEKKMQNLCNFAKNSKYALQMNGRWESNIIFCFPFMYSQKWNCYFQNRIIMFHLPVRTLIYLWEIYIFPKSVCLCCCRKYVDRSWECINRSQTHECWNWDWSCAIPRKGIHKWDFCCSVGLKLSFIIGQKWNFPFLIRDSMNS